MKVIDIYNMLDAWAPFSTQMNMDNAGLLIGGENMEVTGITVCLDITEQVVLQAVRQNTNLIVSHHPVIFTPIKSVSFSSIPYLLIKNGISAICAHTNLDAAEGGVNDVLAGLLELEEVAPLETGGEETPPIGRIGNLKQSYCAAEFAALVKGKLSCGGVRYTGVEERISRVALCGGSGAEYLIPAKAAGAQALVTGEAKHHELLLARELGISLVDGGHFCTERPIVAEIIKRISGRFGSICVYTAVESEPALYL